MSELVEILRFGVRSIRARFRDQRAELVKIRQHIRPGDTVCDVGSNKGSFVYWLSRWCGSGQVIAFEPQPALAHRLATICTRLKLSNVRVESKAVYSVSGSMNLYIPDGHEPGASLSQPLGTSTAVRVPVTTLSDYFGEENRVAMIKIDVEGAELNVLKGAERILRQFSPLLVFECENRHLASGSVQDVFSYLFSLGYDGSFVSGGQILPIEEFDHSVHQPQIGDWYWKNKNYCNNFIFKAR
jgi:FkbM family methyltransferase